MARKTKIEPEKGINGAGPESAADIVIGTSGPKKKSRSAAVKPKAKKPAAKKKAGATTSTTREKTSAPAPAAEPTDDAIRIRAYFLAERRLRLSLPGDSAHDWIEARRQLIEEAQ